MLHPDEGTIHAWLDDQLPPEERAKLEQHFDQCEQCAVLVVDARGLVAGASRIVGTLDGVRSGVVPPMKRISAAPPTSLWRALRLTPVRAAIAATALLATATVFAVRQGGQTRDTARASAAMPASTPIPAASALSAAGGAAAPAAKMRQPEASKSITTRSDQSTAVDSIAAEVPRSKVLAQAVGVSRGNQAVAGASGMAAARSAVADSAAVDARREIVANARQAIQADSISMRTAMKAAPAPQPATPLPRRAFAGSVQLSDVVVTSMTQTADPRAFGCYRLDFDSLRIHATSLRQFGLSAPNGVNVVNALGNSGRPDSVIAGAVWRAVDRDSVAVSTPRSSPPTTLIFALAEEGHSVAGRLIASGQTMPVQVLRIRCP